MGLSFSPEVFTPVYLYIYTNWTVISFKVLMKMLAGHSPVRLSCDPRKSRPVATDPQCPEFTLPQ